MDMIDLLNCIAQLLKNNIALIDCLTVVQGRGQEEGQPTRHGLGATIHAGSELTKRSGLVASKEP